MAVIWPAHSRGHFFFQQSNSHSLQNIRYQTERFDGIINYTLCWSYQDWLPCLEYNHIIREDHKNFLDSIVTEGDGKSTNKVQQSGAALGGVKTHFSLFSTLLTLLGDTFCWLKLNTLGWGENVAERLGPCWRTNKPLCKETLDQS